MAKELAYMNIFSYLCNRITKLYLAHSNKTIKNKKNDE